MLRRTRGVGALLAALIFLVQGFGAAYAQGVGGRAVVLDAFGNPLCMDSRGHAPGKGGRHAALTDCCALACAGLAGVLVMPGEAAGIVVPDARLLARLAGAIVEARRVAADRMAGDPRAPPHSMEIAGRRGHPTHRTAA